MSDHQASCLMILFNNKNGVWNILLTIFLIFALPNRLLRLVPKKNWLVLGIATVDWSLSLQRLTEKATHQVIYWDVGRGQKLGSSQPPFPFSLLSPLSFRVWVGTKQSVMPKPTIGHCFSSMPLSNSFLKSTKLMVITTSCGN